MDDKSSQILLMADPHLSCRPQDEYRWKVLDQIAAVLRRFRPDALVILGDLCHEKDNHNAHLVNRIVEWLDSLSGYTPKVHILMGNHDYVNPEMPYFRFLQRLENVEYYAQPERVQIAGQQCVFIPHRRDFQMGDYKLALYEESAYLFLHQMVGGATVASGYQIPWLATDRAFFEQLKVGAIYSGDVHIPQTVGSVTYVGAPYPIAFGDDYMGRLILLEGGVSQGGSEVVIDLHHPAKAVATIRRLEELEGQFNPGDQVRVVVQLTRSEFKGWAEIRQRVKEWAKLESIELYGVELRPITRERLKRAETKKPTLSTPKDVFLGFCTARAVDDELRSVGEQIYVHQNN